jgi:hypothetical protein
MKKYLFLSLFALLAVASSPAAFADEWHHRGEDRHWDGRDRPDRDWHWRGDIRRFQQHDLEVWHRGHWYQGPHDGRIGWWWIVGGGWYFYPAPVYPYPNPYVPPTVIVTPAAPAAPPQYWYYCPNPAGYYPYIAVCPVPWDPIAVPPGSPAIPPN